MKNTEDNQDNMDPPKKSSSIPIDQLFENSQAAIQYGETATIGDIIKLYGTLSKIHSQHIVNVNTNTQLFQECLHAFEKSDWYKTHQSS